MLSLKRINYSISNLSLQVVFTCDLIAEKMELLYILLYNTIYICKSYAQLGHMNLIICSYYRNLICIYFMFGSFKNRMPWRPLWYFESICLSNDAGFLKELFYFSGFEWLIEKLFLSKCCWNLKRSGSTYFRFFQLCICF